jgi:type II secretory ATPase GspE/PulE/Tfp pilus assembly ATPase PilB-like protein
LIRLIRGLVPAGLGLVVLVLAGPSVLVAQDDPNAAPVSSDEPGGNGERDDARTTPAGDDADNGTASVTTASRPAGSFPKNPYGFFRGNGPPERVGGARAIGFYLNTFLLLVVLGLFFAWIKWAAWIDADSRSLSIDGGVWNAVMLFGGVAGFLLALVLPRFVGLVPLMAGIGAPLGLYIRERNGHVPAPRRVMTPNHIRGYIIRKLALIGIRIGSEVTVESAFGPPIRFIGKSDANDRGESERRSRQVENSKGFLAAKELIYDAIERRATDVHLEPKEGELSVRVRIDGVMYPFEPFDTATGRNVLNIFKVLSGMDITERRRPQDGSFGAALDDRKIDFRSATQGTSHGEKMSLRILDQSNSVSRLADLGFRKALFDLIRQSVTQPHGMFLACGPTGAGKSTTLYAALSEIDPFQHNIITVEDPIEYKMANVNQIEVNRRSGQTFATSLRSILRQDPDVVMVGEIRDEETATIACQAANTGHMVFSTVHANDTITALYRLLELGVEPFMIANSVSAILGQRLARRLCSVCREPYAPNDDLMRRAGLPPGRIDCLYRPPQRNGSPKARSEDAGPDGSCYQCGGLGYYGRVGVFELLVISERMRDLIREKAPASAIKAEARKNGLLTMKEEGLRLVIKGITSVNELIRVVK